jgi:hypothetical protein
MNACKTQENAYFFFGTIEKRLGLLKNFGAPAPDSLFSPNTPF